MKKIVIAIGVIIVILGAFAFTQSNKEESQIGQEQKSTQSETVEMKDSKEISSDTVAIEGFKYQPESMTVKKGTTVTWENRDNTQHNVVFDDQAVGQVDGGKLIGQGETVSFTFDKVGEFPYHCMPHPYMKASVTVTE